MTGAAGFIGSHLVDALLAHSCPVVGIDDFDPWYDPVVKRANLAGALVDPSFSLIEGNLVIDGGGGIGFDDLVDAMAGAGVVFHLAGRPGVQDSWGRGFGASVERNIAATQRVYEAALAAGVGRVVYASSSSVYGTSSAGRGPREPAPVSPYGVAKLAGEHLAAVYRERGLAVTSLRYFTVYGPRQRPDMAIHRLFDATRAGGPTFVLRGEGTQRREFTHVADVVRATLAAGWRPEAADATIDIGGGSSVALGDVIDAVEEITGSPVRLRRQPAVAGDPATTAADHTSARQLLAWAPAIDLDRGLRSQWRWHRHRAGGAAPSASPSGDRTPTSAPGEPPLLSLLRAPSRD